MNNIKHIFFDLDHTLWDFEKNSQEALFEIYTELNLDKYTPSFDRFIKKYREINQRYWNLYRQNKVTKEQVRKGRFVDTVAFFKISEKETLAEILSHKYITLSPTKTNLFPGTHQTLKKLSKKYPLHIITNGFTEVQHTKLEKSNLQSYFKTVVCSEETNFKKPHKNVFNFALNKANALAKHSLMVGDSLEADVLGAKKIGMKSIWFNPNKNTNLKNVLQIHLLNELSTILPL